MQVGTRRKRILLITACSVASGMVFSARVWAQSAPAPIIIPTTPDTGNGPIIPGGAATPVDQAVHIAKIKKFYKELLLKEKNVAAAVSHIDKKQIDSVAVAGSIQSLLKQTPSVNEYQQNLGQSVPVLTVRGVRNSQLAQTLDGIPLQDLLSGGQGAFLNNNVGSPVTLGQISGTTVYPGVAPPNEQGFATIGGTIAYETKKPSATPSAELFGGYGSFDTSNYGFELNTGAYKNQVDGVRALLRYSQTYTAGYTDNTNSRYGDMLFAFDKPYDEGLSHITGTVIYNRGNGYVLTSPLPVALLNQYGPSFNFPKSTTYNRQNDSYLTAILGDETYINPHLIVSGKLFYIHNTTNQTNYLTPAINPSVFNPALPYGVDGQSLAQFYTASNFGPGNTFYKPGLFTYNPGAVFGQAYAGLAATQTDNHTTTVGFTPRLNIFLPHNNITVGALFAKETSAGSEYIYGTDPMPEIAGYNSFGLGGGAQRTVYTAFLSDKIELLDNKLHIEPGISLTGVYSSVKSPLSYFNPSYKLANYGSTAEPYLGVSYDFPHNIVAYASYGKGARFAPTTDYSLGSAGSTTAAPGPEIVHAYEAGLRYDTARLYLNADIYYQKVNDAFSFYTNYNTGLSSYINVGEQQFRGVEASGKFRVTPEIELFGNGSYNQANYLNSYSASVTPFQGQFGYAFKGDPVTSVPKWLGNFGVEYDHGPFSARFAGQYTGQQYTTFDYSPTDAAYIPGTAQPASGFPGIQYALTTSPNKTFLLPGFLTLNVLLKYNVPIHYGSMKKLTLSLNVRNLLGLNYYSHFYNVYQQISGPASGATPYLATTPYASAFYGPPRTIFASVSAKF
jgi:iron complex outermembrane receptor protein